MSHLGLKFSCFQTSSLLFYQPLISDDSKLDECRHIADSYKSHHEYLIALNEEESDDEWKGSKCSSDAAAYADDDDCEVPGCPEEKTDICCDLYYSLHHDNMAQSDIKSYHLSTRWSRANKATHQEKVS